MTQDHTVLENCKTLFDDLMTSLFDDTSEVVEYRLWEFIRDRAENALEASDVTNEELEIFDSRAPQNIDD